MKAYLRHYWWRIGVGLVFILAAIVEVLHDARGKAFIVLWSGIILQLLIHPREAKK